MQISQNEMRIQSWRISSFGLCMTCTTCNSANRVCWYINIIIWYSSSTIVLSVINIRADNNFQSIHDFCPFCNIKCLFTGSVCTVWLGADRRKPQGTGETQTPILGHLIWDVPDWLVGVAKYLRPCLIRPKPDLDFKIRILKPWGCKQTECWTNPVSWKQMQNLDIVFIQSLSIYSICTIFFKMSLCCYIDFLLWNCGHC